MSGTSLMNVFSSVVPERRAVEGRPFRLFS